MIPDQEEFELWMARMESALFQFLDQIPAQTRPQWNFTASSLGLVETWILRTFADARQLTLAPERWDGVARYIGETFRRNQGGTWRVNLTHPASEGYRVPFVDVPSALLPPKPFELPRSLLNLGRRNMLTALHADIADRQKPPTGVRDPQFLQAWLAKSDRELRVFETRFLDLDLTAPAGSGSGDLDYSLSSLEHVEAWAHQMFGFYTQFNDDADEWHQLMARYIGEVFRRNLGGEWTQVPGAFKGTKVYLPVLHNFPGCKGFLNPAYLLDQVIQHREPKACSRAFLQIQRATARLDG